MKTYMISNRGINDEIANVLLMKNEALRKITLDHTNSSELQFLFMIPPNFFQFSSITNYYTILSIYNKIYSRKEINFKKETTSTHIPPMVTKALPLIFPELIMPASIAITQ